MLSSAVQAQQSPVARSAGQMASHRERATVIPALVFPGAVQCAQQLGRSAGYGLVLVTGQPQCKIGRHGTGLYLGYLQQVRYRRGPVVGIAACCHSVEDRARRSAAQQEKPGNVDGPQLRSSIRFANYGQIGMFCTSELTGDPMGTRANTRR